MPSGYNSRSVMSIDVLSEIVADSKYQLLYQNYDRLRLRACSMKLEFDGCTSSCLNTNLPALITTRWDAQTFAGTTTADSIDNPLYEVFGSKSRVVSANSTTTTHYHSITDKM